MYSSTAVQSDPQPLLITPPPHPRANPTLSPPQSGHLAAAFAAQQDFIALAAACTKPSPTSPAFASALGPTQQALMAAVDLKDKNRPSKDFNGLTMVAEGIPALGWVTLVRRRPLPR